MLKKNKSNRTLDDDSKKTIKNPLLRSGLLFAGAKNTLNGNPPRMEIMDSSQHMRLHL